jgi:hypothetical protein
METIAESWLVRFFTELKVGMASNIKTVMMAMTISNSIRVKPLGGALRRLRRFKQMRFISVSIPLWAAKNPPLPRKSYNVWTRKGNGTFEKQVTSEQVDK